MLMFRRLHRIGRKIGILLVALICATVVASIATERVVVNSAKGRLFDSALALPKRDVGLVLGTSPKVVGGSPNILYEMRLDAAAELFDQGRIKCLLVSGDNGDSRYNEPYQMKLDLIKRGVSTDRIVCDYAGFRTLDSVVRASKVFGQQPFVVISQAFHNERAIYIASAKGLDVVGYNAADTPTGVGAWIRERFARIAAILDTKLTNRQPRFLGEREPMPIDGVECEGTK